MAGALSHADLEALWVASGGLPQYADTAAAVAQAESGGDLSAIHNTAYPNLPGYKPPLPGNLPEYSIGYWQINQYAHQDYTIAGLKTPIGNATAAVAISNGGTDFAHWTTYVDGAYRPFLLFDIPTQPGQGAGGAAPAGAIAPQGHKGYADLRNSLGRHLPTQLERSKHTGQRTMSLLTHRTKGHR